MSNNSQPLNISNPFAITYTGNGGGGGVPGTNGWINSNISTTTSFASTVGNYIVNTSCDAKDVKMSDGTTLQEALEKINDRLAILTPKPELLEKFQALKAAYEHYKILEALVSNAEPGTDE